MSQRINFSFGKINKWWWQCDTSSYIELQLIVFTAIYSLSFSLFLYSLRRHIGWLREEISLFTRPVPVSLTIPNCLYQDSLPYYSISTILPNSIEYYLLDYTRVRYLASTQCQSGHKHIGWLREEISLFMRPVPVSLTIPIPIPIHNYQFQAYRTIQ